MARLDNPKPVFRVDDDVAGRLRDDVRFVSIDHDTRGLKRLCASFVAQSRSELTGEQPVQYLDGELLDFGKPIAVTLGAGSEARTVFEGRISGLEAELGEGQPARVTVFAEDGLMALRMTRRSKTYRDASDEDMAREIAQLHELEFEGSAAGPTYEIVQQWNQSDLAFLRARARLRRAEIWIRGDTLCFKSRDHREAPSIDPLSLGGQLLEVSVRADLAHQRSRVAVSGYDADKKEGFDGASDADAIAGETSGGRTGFTVLDRAFGTKHESLRVREVPQNKTEADAFAKGEAQRRGRRFVTANGVVDGAPDLAVGCRLDLRRVGAAFTGTDYYVTRVRHTWHPERGHRVAFEAERSVLTEAS